MNPITLLYNEILWRPLFNGLVFFYTILPWHDVGLSIILLTATIRLILAPLFWKAQRSQRDLAKIQPEIKRIQQELKSDKDAQGKALMQLYATHKVNPFSGCLLLLLQLPILIALLQVFRQGLDPAHLSSLYSFIHNPTALNPVSFGIADLSKGNLYLGALAAISQFLQTKLTMPPMDSGAAGNDFAKAMNWQGLYLFPVLIFAWSYSLPAALTLYWTTMSVFGIVQEIATRKFGTEHHGSGINKTRN